MKKLLVAILALGSVTAFAHDGDHKHMVRMYGWDSGSRAMSFDLSKTSDDKDSNAKTDKTNVALNYAYAINGNWQVGATYKSVTGKDAGTKVDANTMGLSGYYNLDGKVEDTCYVALHYNMTSYGKDGSSINGVSGNKDDKQTDIVLEYGHRFSVGSAWGFHLTYAPAVSYTMSDFDDDTAGVDNIKTNTLAWNFLKFDVLF